MELLIELLLYISLSFFSGYAIGKIRGSDEVFDEWNKYIQDHTVYDPITNEYKLR